MKNIFKGSKIGDKFETECGDIAIFIKRTSWDNNTYLLFLLMKEEKFYYHSDGTINTIGMDSFNITKKWTRKTDKTTEEILSDIKEYDYLYVLNSFAEFFTEHPEIEKIGFCYSDPTTVYQIAYCFYGMNDEVIENVDWHHDKVATLRYPSSWVFSRRDMKGLERGYTLEKYITKDLMIETRKIVSEN